MVGSRKTTPPIEEVSTTWPQPWIFFRALLGTLVVYLAFHFAWRSFGNPGLVPGLILTGSFAMPISTLILFVELNARRNVSMFQVSKLVVSGGLMAVIAALLLFEISDLFTLDWLGSSIGGLVEEPAKVFALLLVASLPRYKYILNGLLFGAAIGAGFAAFESAGYAFVVGIREADPDAMTSSILARGLLSPLGHIVWTAMCGGALWKVKGDRLFQFRMLVDPRFLRVLAIATVLHMIWNSSLELPFFGTQIIVGLVGWIVVLALVSDGLQQLEQEKSELDPQSD